MEVGFTGTRNGMTNGQLEQLRKLLVSLAPETFHHGDCIGADDEAHREATKLEIATVSHPPANPKARAFCLANVISKPIPYSQRNLAIVRQTDVLIAAPESKEGANVRSGTWQTVRMARRHKRPIYIINRDGVVTKEN